MKIKIVSKHLAQINVSELKARYSARRDRILSYQIDLRHKLLNQFKVLTAPDVGTLQGKVDVLVAAWDDKFEKFQAQDTADDATAQAVKKLDALRSILTGALKMSSEVKWSALKTHIPYQMPSEFPEIEPQTYAMQIPHFVEPKVGFFTGMFGRRNKIIAVAESEHRLQLSVWKELESKRLRDHATEVKNWNERRVKFWTEHRAAEATYMREISENETYFNKMELDWRKGESVALVDWATLVLEGSDYDALFEKSFLIQYRKENKLLLIDYDLPTPTQIPRILSVKIAKATGEFKETFVSDREQKANFDSVIYQICLRTLHEIFEADEIGNVNQILFNGYVNFVDQATGQDTRSCLLSVLADRSTFCGFDLARVDAKACFKSLKGVSASSLAALTPIPPVMQLDKSDRRFVEGHAVAENLSTGTNLASIHWEEFEHLIRELFEREFQSRGGEVKVTQASRDGGVDAVAFDPDPITGGKIVIQAKRYTRTVGVSAVRDLYGTVMNEGASKGILVTTADYGPDAYQFANGKPLTLMNGSNLLYLMQRHGYNAKIDLREARETERSNGELP